MASCDYLGFTFSTLSVDVYKRQVRYCFKGVTLPRAAGFADGDAAGVLRGILSIRPLTDFYVHLNIARCLFSRSKYFERPRKALALAGGGLPIRSREAFQTVSYTHLRLKVSRRTLQDYRNEGRIAYIQLGGKILYRESDIERMLADSYRSAYRLTAT